MYTTVFEIVLVASLKYYSLTNISTEPGPNSDCNSPVGNNFGGIQFPSLFTSRSIIS